jgi:hypothetical protein
VTAIQAKTQAKFLATLTAEQRQKLTTLDEDRGPGGGMRGPGGPGGGSRFSRF